MKTIIQTIGPLYGDVVNGSVFGQPNGDVARPPQNTPASVILSGDSGTITLDHVSGGQIAHYALAGVSAAIVDSGVAVKIQSRFFNASNVLFATGGGLIANGATIDTFLTGHADANVPSDGDAVTMTVKLLDQYGSTIAESSALTITAVIPE